MSKLLDDIAYLSQDIGPRPAGTEEEHQAAQYLADRFQKDIGLATEVEEFATSNQMGLAVPILFGISALISLFGLIVAKFAIVPFAVTLACVALIAAELLDKPILSRLINKGISQNVIAKYCPNEAKGKRSRKVILVANYDSARVRPELSSLVRILPMLQMVVYIAEALLPLFWLLFFFGDGGMICTVFIAILLVPILLPVIQAILHCTGTYNDAANNNASGAAALVELAQRVSAGAWEEVPEFEEKEEPRIYGAEVARVQGVIPEGVPIDYEVEPNVVFERQAPVAEEDLEAMREETTAVFTGETPFEDDQRGKPPTTGPFDIRQGQEPSAEKEPLVRGEPVTVAEGGQVEQEESNEQALEEKKQEHEAPAWFISAQKKANKSKKTAPVKRSRYADALDAAAAESGRHGAEANEAIKAGVAAGLQAHEEGNNEVVAPKSNNIPEHSDYLPRTEAHKADTLHETDQGKPEPPVKPEAAIYRERSEYEFDVAGDVPSMPDKLQSVQNCQQDEAGATTAIPPIDVSGMKNRLYSVTSREPQAPARTQDQPASQPTPVSPRTKNRFIVNDEGQGNERQVSPAGEKGNQRGALAEQETHTLPKMQLPEIDILSEEPSPIGSLKQRAPLAEAAKRQPMTSGTHDPGLSSQIPRIILQPTLEEDDEMPANKRAALRQTLPTLSGTISAVPPQPENKTVSLTSSFAAVGTERTFAPVGDELIAGTDPNELYIDDADDSVFDENCTQTGAYVDSGYMEMPSKHRFFGKLRRKKKQTEEEQNASDWLGVDENFNPTEVGAQRGGWESFQNTSNKFDYTKKPRGASPSDESSTYAPRDWNGGAFSRRRVDPNEGAPTNAEGVRQPRRSTDCTSAKFAEVADLAAAKTAEKDSHQMIAAETKQVYDFRNSSVSIETWFVALGAGYANNAGMKAFLSKHAGELRGSIVINLEALGAGDLSAIEEEGFLFMRKPSSRVKRYLRSASQASGIAPATASLPWRESAATIAACRGLQAITLAGMDGAKPANYAQKDDTLHIIDENTLEQNIAFVNAILKIV